MNDHPNDYLAMLTKEPEDAEQAGVKGMKWGVHRSRAERAEAAKKAAGEKKDEPPKQSPQEKEVFGAASGETSASRYSRLAAEAKSGKASDMSDQDLKFFNARTEALAKVNKLNETKPGWLQDTTKTVLQTTAKNQMQNVSDTLANKYIGAPITSAIKGTAKKKD